MLDAAHCRAPLTPWLCSFLLSSPGSTGGGLLYAHVCAHSLGVCVDAWPAETRLLTLNVSCFFSLPKGKFINGFRLNQQLKTHQLPSMTCFCKSTLT